MRLLRQHRSFLSALAVLALLVLDINLVDFCVANPYLYTGEVPPDKETYPPVITISTPVNNTAYNASRVPLTFNVTAPQSKTASYTTVIKVSYETDWYKEPISVLNGGHEQASFNLWLSNMPEGKHNIVIKAVGYGLYEAEEQWSYKEFRILSTATIIFTVDRTAPNVLVFLPENLSSTTIIPLNLTVSESYSTIVYSLNGQQNVTISGNSTIPHLSAGQYNVTFYVWDTAGNLGASETASFRVTEIPQTIEPAEDFIILPAIVVLSTVVVVGAALLLKRRTSNQ